MPEASADNAISPVDQIVGAMDETGFCVVPNVLSRDEATTLANIVLTLQEAEARGDVAKLGHARVLHLLAKHPAFVQLLTHPIVTAVNEQYLSSDFICSTFSSNCALPGTDLTYWHCDHPYWTIAPPYQVDPPLTAHVIWCLTDMSDRTGGTKFVPGSHRRQHLPAHEADHDFEAVTPNAPAGSLIFAHGATWHSAGRNDSDDPRIGIFVRYARSFLIPQEDMRLQLPAIDNPDDLVRRLMGGDQYVPQRGYPY